jgi:hypothetical protein
MTTRAHSKKTSKTNFSWGYVYRKDKELRPYLPPLGFTGPKKTWCYSATLACRVGTGEPVYCEISVPKGLYEILKHDDRVPVSFQLIDGKPKNIRFAQ